MGTDGLVAALARAQAVMSHPKKTKTNPHFKSDYADLADVLNAVRPALNAEGIALVQTVDNGDLVTELRWGTETIASRLPLNLNVKPQELGSQLSYLRRYALSAIVGVASEADDDGNAAQTAPARPQARPWMPPTIGSASGEGISADSYALAAENPPEKPLAAMTAGEMARYGESIGVRVTGSKADILRQLEPYVMAATGAEPFLVDSPKASGFQGDGEAVGPSMSDGSAPSPPPRLDPADIPFNPTSAADTDLRRMRPDARASVRKGTE